MTVEWSGPVPDLLLMLDRGGTSGLRSQLEDQLRAAVRDGRLGAGERLPSSRQLARSLGVSRGLIQDCYTQLQAEGYLTARAGSATRVASVAAVDEPASRTSRPDRPAAQLIADFAPGVPDLGEMPRNDWVWSVREACRTAPHSAFGYGDPRGDITLRHPLAAYLRRVRAVHARSEQIVVCAGFHQGLLVVLQALARHGLTRIACEDPGFITTITAAAQHAGSEVVPVPVDEDGIDVAALRATSTRAVVLTPAHQWATGGALAAHRRRELVAWANDCDGVIIEDEYDAEFRYDRSPIGSIQGLASERTFNLGTLSKSLAPAMRLGWIVAPPRFLDDVVAVKRVSDLGTSGLDQLALAVLLESGRYDRHLRRMRIKYSARRDALITAVEEYAPGLRVTGLAAGLHAVGHLPSDLDEASFVEAARERRVGMYGMSAYRFDHSPRPAQVVIGFGNTRVTEIQAGMRAIGPLLHGPS